MYIKRKCSRFVFFDQMFLHKRTLSKMRRRFSRSFPLSLSVFLLIHSERGLLFTWYYMRSTQSVFQPTVRFQTMTHRTTKEKNTHAHSFLYTRILWWCNVHVQKRILFLLSFVSLKRIKILEFWRRAPSRFCGSSLFLWSLLRVTLRNKRLYPNSICFSRYA